MGKKILSKPYRRNFPLNRSPKFHVKICLSNNFTIQIIGHEKSSKTNWKIQHQILDLISIMISNLTK